MSAPSIEIPIDLVIGEDQASNIIRSRLKGISGQFDAVNKAINRMSKSYNKFAKEELGKPSIKILTESQTRNMDIQLRKSNLIVLMKQRELVGVRRLLEAEKKRNQLIQTERRDSETGRRVLEHNLETRKASLRFSKDITIQLQAEEIVLKKLIKDEKEREHSLQFQLELIRRARGMLDSQRMPARTGKGGVTGEAEGGMLISSFENRAGQARISGAREQLQNILMGTVIPGQTETAAGFEKLAKTALQFRKRVEESMKALDKAGKDQTEIMAAVGASQEKILSVEEELGNKRDQMATAMAVAKTAAKSFAIQMKSLAREEALVAKETKKITQRKTTYKKILEDTRRDLVKFRKEQEKVRRKTNSLGRSLSRAGRQARNFGRNLQFTARDILFTVGALGSFAIFGVKSFAELEKSAIQLGIAMGETGDAFDVGMAQIKDGFDIARSFGVSLQETAEMLIEVQQAGFRGAESMIVFNQAVLLGKATFSDTQTAVDTLTDVMVSFRESLPQDTFLSAAKASDILTNTANQTNITLSELRTSMQFVSGIAEAYSFSLADVAAALGVLQQAGIPPSVGARRFGSVLDSLATKGKLYIRDFLDPATGELRSMGEQFDLLQVQYDSFGTDLDRAGFLSELFGARQAELVKKILANRDALDELAESNRNVNGITEEFANDTTPRLDLALKAVINTIDEMKIATGEAIGKQLMQTGVLERLVDVLKDAAPFFEEIGAGIGKGVTRFLEDVVNLFRWITKGTDAVTNGLEATTTHGQRFAKMMMDLLDRIGIRFGFIKFIFDGIGKIIDKIFGDTGGSSVEAIASGLTQIALFAVAAVPILAGLGVAIEVVGASISLLTPVLGGFIFALNTLKTTMALGFQGAGAAATGASGFSKIMAGIIGGIIGATIGPIIAGAGGGPEAAAIVGRGAQLVFHKALFDAGGGLMGFVKLLAKASIVISVVAFVIGGLVGAIQATIKIFDNLGTSMEGLTGISDGLGAIFGAIMGVINPLMQILGDILRLFYELGRFAGVVLIQGLLGIIDGFARLVGGLFGAITVLLNLQDLWDDLGRLTQWLLDGLDNLANGFTEMVDGVAKATDILINSPEILVEGISNVIVMIGDAIVKVIVDGFNALTFGAKGLIEDFEQDRWQRSGKGSIEERTWSSLGDVARWFSSFQTGGTVPGAGSVPIIAHGGEPVFSSRDADTLNTAIRIADGRSTTNNNNNVTQNITFIIKADDPMEADRTIKQISEKLKQVMA
ncbi:hypothetical protein LCGC14_0267160 [marine sediment metagenome]|uniref:Phage tail tape measure protein domain-containing protein n=1 Tax=marine sediment metagenome TaxID=412755 RepID=A0A0F9TZV5_9ZZZZ